MDKIITADARNLEKFLGEKTVDLSIIKPPYYHLESDPSKHIKLIKDVMKAITSVTKIGGICCLILSEDMKRERGMDITETRALMEVIDDPEIGSKWRYQEQILWVKSSRDVVESLMPIEEVTMVSFDLTPFSIIYLLTRIDSDENELELDISERIENLKISEIKRQEMFDSMWFIPPRSEKNYKDCLPKELVIRLIMLFSKERDLVFDPFSGDGITALAAKVLKRNYFCIEKNQKKVEKAKLRIKK